MKINYKKVLYTIITAISLAPLNLKAQEKELDNKTTYSIETDPSTFAFKGYAIHLRIKPKPSSHWVIGAGTYALNMPAMMVNLNNQNKNKGWNVRINSAYSLFGEYYFKEANKKWFIGMQAGIQNFKNTNNNVANKMAKYSNLLLMPSIGYNWQPFKFPVYIKPWFGLGYTKKISGNHATENLAYHISPLVPFATLHVGYTFNK